jgi:hypothetical protein
MNYIINITLITRIPTIVATSEEVFIDEKQQILYFIILII